MKSIHAKQTPATHQAAGRRMPTRRTTGPPVVAEPRVINSSASFGGSAVTVHEHTSCSRFDLNALLKQLAHDVHATVSLRVELCTQPMPIFANIGHLSLALQELVRFLMKFLASGETVALASAPSSAQEVLRCAESASHALFSLSNWNVAQNSRRAFAMITIIKEGAIIPNPLIERFMRAARNAGHVKDGEHGIRRLGRVLRKHRINLVIDSSASAGTIFRLFVSLADVGK